MPDMKLLFRVIKVTVVVFFGDNNRDTKASYNSYLFQNLI
ncbi:uncharacterized protein METZ01_LOCUS81873 [marine metagenome]|uniref:Uncharacterized protein n=1 Tax=marine metagenome TaxID=408172 RepID=A0A381ULM3_9ZZZZ